MCGKCDSIEGNLCTKCEHELQEVKHQALYDDGWWPVVAAGMKRSINVASSSNEQPENMLYV